MSFLIDAIVPVLAAADPSAASGGNPITDLADKFHVEVPILLAQAINFIVVAALLYYFAFKPVLKTVGERQQKIADGLQYAEEMKQKLSDAEKERAETVRNAQIEAQKILEDSRAQARQFEEEQRNEATRRAEQIVEKAREATEQERTKMLSEVRGEVTRLVVATTSRVLSKDLSEDEKKRFHESASKEIASLN